MDFTDAMKAGGASTVLLVVVGLAYKLIQMACNHRVKSDCCGRQGVVGVEVEAWNGTPPKEAFKPEVKTPEVKVETV